jgi:2-polyprenyl-3-methyl-5-hydroxy-6-metoxy-1,4-benzoquinol methylase
MTQPTTYFNADRDDFLQFLNSAGKFGEVLDIGCAAGSLGSRLVESDLAEAVDGIEINPAAAAKASQRLRTVWHGSVEDLLPKIPLPAYSLIIMADSLEHLVDPWQVLRDLQENSSPETKIAVSVPNLREKNVILPLLFQGRFQYQDAGVMDRTHLHFFTRSSLIALLSDTGWSVEKIHPNIKQKYLKWWYPHKLLEQFITVQYFMLAHK